MNEFTVPQYFLGTRKEPPSPYLLPYHASKSTIKNKVLLTTHMFSFLTEGKKEIVVGNASIKFDTNEFVLITAGKCFMSEKLSAAGNYSSTLLFFDNHFLQGFFESQKNKIQKIIENNKLQQREIILFKNDDFTKSYIQSLKFISNKSEELARVKLQEILLYLLETQPSELCGLFVEHPTTSEEIRFKNIIISHIDSDLSLNELAYLCNVSLSTFKRRFTAMFNDSPNNWIRQKRMEHAAFLLRYNKERVSDLYLRLGYENHSSFSQSFKSIFGVSPKEYQLQN